MRFTANIHLRILLVLCLMGMGAGRVSACKYCEMASDPSLRAMFSSSDRTGPSLTATPSPSPSPVALSPAANVVTRIEDLRTNPAAMAKLAVRGLPSPAPGVQKVSAARPVVASAKQRPPEIRWADAGLLGLAAAGGFFCWRTRRTIQ